MINDKWKSYNHMIIPRNVYEKNEKLNKKQIHDLWNEYRGSLLIISITDWDISNETEWYYIIKDDEINIADLRKSVRSQVRKGLNNYTIEKIDWHKNFDTIYDIYLKASTRYSSFKPKLKSQYMNQLNEYSDNVECWAAFNRETNRIDGYCICSVFEKYVDWNEAKFIPEALKLRVSDAFEYCLIEHYINIQNKRFILSGQRNINHVTNVQEYDIKNFGFRKAYCNVEIIYKQYVKAIVCFLYFARHLLKKFDQNRLIHKLNSLLLLEEIRRSYK